MVPLGVITAQPAAAATVTQCAKAAGKATFTPPLPKLGSTKKVKSKLTATGTVSSCVGGAVTRGTTKFTQTSTSTGANCSTLVQPKASDPPVKGTLVITWFKGNAAAGKSTASGFAIKQTDATHANTTGKITAGKFKGKAIVGKVVFEAESGGCTQKDLAHVTYKNTPNTKFVIK
jgi:hypothetical protein